MPAVRDDTEGKFMTKRVAKDANARKRKKIQEKKTSAQVLLELSGSWDDERSSEEIIMGIKQGRKNSRKLEVGF